MEDNYIEAANRFKAYCDENRLKIIEQLINGETCACTLLENLTIAQSTLSHHMKILNESGIVKSRKKGKWTYYSLSKNGLDLTINYLERIKINLDENKFDNNINCV